MADDDDEIDVGAAALRPDLMKFFSLRCRCGYRVTGMTVVGTRLAMLDHFQYTGDGEVAGPMLEHQVVLPRK